MGISTDLSDSQSVKSAFNKISQQYAGSSLAAAVFNLGGGFVQRPFLELTEEEFSRGFESQGLVHFFIYIYLCIDTCNCGICTDYELEKEDLTSPKELSPSYSKPKMHHNTPQP